jgi:hypothetical protein
LELLVILGVASVEPFINLLQMLRRFVKSMHA